MKRVVFIFVALIVFSGCTLKEVKEEESITFFTRNDFRNDSSLVGEVIEFNTPLHPLSYTIIRDSLIFVTNWDGHPYFIEVYNLNTKSHVTSIARKGNGPNEVLSCYLHYRTSKDYFYVHDILKQNVIKYNIDSALVLGNSYSPLQIQVPGYTKDLAFLNSGGIVGLNSYYFETEKIKNDVPPLFLVSNVKNDNAEVEENYAKYFTTNVSGGYLLVSPTTDNIWIVDRYKDKINIYNKDQKLIKSLVGPDVIKPEYTIREGNAVSFKRQYSGYLSCFYTEDAVYLNYMGVNGISNDENYRKPVELLKFSWSGELLYRYKLDKYIFTTSIDKDEKYLYGTHFNSPDEYPQLIRYTLPESFIK